MRNEFYEIFHDMNAFFFHLTVRRKILPRKLMINQLLKKLQVCHIIRRIFTVFKGTVIISYPEPAESGCCILHAAFLLSLLFETGIRCFLQKCQLTFTGLHDVTFQETELFS
jgi:hypothetical protein